MQYGILRSDMDWCTVLIIAAFLIGCLAAFGGDDEHY